MDLADCLVHMYEKPLGGWARRYEWRGSASLPLRVSKEMLRDLITSDPHGREWPERIDLDGIPLKYLPGSEKYDETFIYNAALYVRIDGVGRAWWLYRVVRTRVLRAFWFLYERSILTLHVWGLADYPRGCRPSWRDIKLFRKNKS